MRCILALLLGFSLVACDDGGGDTGSDTSGSESSSSDEGWTSADDGMVDLWEIDVQVQYEGVAPGGLTVGAFTDCPPETPPVSFKRISEPTYPLDVTLVDVEDGEYCVYAYIDEAPENPTFPGDEDPQGYSENFAVNGADGSTTITVIDPSP